MSNAAGTLTKPLRWTRTDYVDVTTTTATIHGSLCGAVVVRHGGREHRGPWLIGGWESLARGVAERLQRAHPAAEVTLTHGKGTPPNVYRATKKMEHSP